MDPLAAYAPFREDHRQRFAPGPQIARQPVEEISTGAPLIAPEGPKEAGGLRVSERPPQRADSPRGAGGRPVQPQSESAPDPQRSDSLRPDSLRPDNLRKDLADTVRPILQAMARVIATDRRAVALVSHKGEILLANAAAQKLGLTRNALLSRLDWPGLSSRARRAGAVAASWSEGDQTFDGEVVHVPLGQAEGYLLRFAESDQESTWLRNRARSATLMRVAHDLRTPIQSLLASANALADAGEIPGEAGQKMRRAAGLALDHISNVLAVVRGEQGRRGGQPDEDFRIVEEIESLVDLVEPIARARATEVILSVDAPPDLVLHGPLRFVRALCQNLIDNSVNHGGGRVELRLSCTRLGAPLPAGEPGDDPADEIWRVGLELLDEGGGLPAAQKARLAEALGLSGEEAAVPEAEPGKRPSAGMNVLAHALRQLGGRITLHDRGSDGLPLPPGAGGRVIGSIFRVSFSLPRAPELATATPATSPPRKPADGAGLEGRRILLVEDSPSSRDWLTHLLRSYGAEVIAVGSGPEALAQLSRDEVAAGVDLVLTDITLPRMSGIELASRLRRGDAASANPWQGKIVGLTAHADEGIRDACLQSGMAAILEKPIQPAALCKTLVRILQDAPLKGPVAPAPAAPLSAALPSETAAAVTARATAGLISPQVSADLIELLGLQPAREFMLRALAEAQVVLDELRREGCGPDTGRRLHAATGASGLTGLTLVERRLRAIELAVKEGQGALDPLLSDLQAAVLETRNLAEEMQP